MSDKNRTCSNEAMEKMIGNMTAEMQNTEGPYINLGFTPPTVPPEQLNWTQQPNYMNHYSAGVEQYPQQPFHYMPPHAPQMYDQNGYKKNFNNLSEFDMYKLRQNGAADMGLFERDYYNHQMMNNMPDHTLLQPHQEQVPLSSNRPPLINLVGNWIGPTINGSYSPFGNGENYKPNPSPSVFAMQPDLTNANIIHQLNDEPKFTTTDHLEDVQFQFNRDTRKPRMVAEVKPMRPSYSDVLTKPVPQTSSKPLKCDTKETKPKKEGKKSTKNDKGQKLGSTLNRSSTNNDIKDISADKNSNQTKSEKSKAQRGSQLNRKWSSLDDITDPQTGKVDDVKKKKVEEKNYNKFSGKKLNKTVNDVGEVESENTKSDTFNVTKNGLKKINKPTVRPKLNDSGSGERPPGKRNQRARKRESHVPFGVVGQKLKLYTKGWWKIFTVFLLWLFHLISDICRLSLHIGRDMFSISWTWICIHWTLFITSTNSVLEGVRLFEWIRNKFRKKSDQPQNIDVPTTGEEAMKRLLACKGKDPYSILGLSPNCTDDDIKRYYRRQAFLVHPDKNKQPGAEEAFKILVTAFGMISVPEKRAEYDRGVVQSEQVAKAWSELTELLQQLQQKVEATATTIRCSSCSNRHKREKIDRPSYAARNCNTCKIHHAAREGDIWAEARVFGFLWHYYACMEGSVYDITEWAGCQKDSLKHLRPDSHHVQYRIALGKQNQARRQAAPAVPTDRPDLENLLNTFYGQAAEGGQGGRRRNRKGFK